MRYFSILFIVLSLCIWGVCHTQSPTQLGVAAFPKLKATCGWWLRLLDRAVLRGLDQHCASSKHRRPNESEIVQCWWALLRDFWILPKLRSTFFFFLGPHLWHMEVPGPGMESELQRPAYTTATLDRSHYELHPSSQQCRILNPLKEVRD